MIREHNLPKDSKVIVHLDCWAVHRSQALRDWLKTIPCILIIYVPANCTSLFQPCDVGLQRLFKQIIRQEAAKFFTKFAVAELQAGYTPEEVSMITDIGPLRDQAPTYLMAAVDYLNSKPNIVLKAWSNCLTSEKRNCFNLSYKSLTSPEAMRAYLDESPEFREDVTHPHIRVAQRKAHKSAEKAAVRKAKQDAKRKTKGKGRGKGKASAHYVPVYDSSETDESEYERDAASDILYEIEDEEDVPTAILEHVLASPPIPPHSRNTRNSQHAKLMLAGQPVPVPRTRTQRVELPDSFRYSLRLGGDGAVSYYEADLQVESEEDEVYYTGAKNGEGSSS